jgi:tetratricopeptide (TPR) repeat protein
MAIEGPIKELSLMDLFQLLAMSRKSGVLTLDSAHDVGQVFFSNGNIIRATLQQSYERLGQIMLKSGKVTIPQVERILTAQSASQERKRFGALAAESGFVTKQAVKEALKTQVEEVVFAIMGWKDGYFRFEEMDFSADTDTELLLVTENVMMEVSRRLDEWSKIHSKLPNLDLVLSLSPGSELASGKLDLKPEEWLIMATIDGKRTARQVIETVGGREFETAKVIYGLCVTGLVRALGKKTDLKLDLQEPEQDPIKKGISFLNEGKIEEAISAFTLLVQKDPEQAHAHLYLGESYYLAESYDEAVMEYKLSSKGEENNPEINYCLGFTYARLGRLELAVERWEKFLRFAGGDKRAEKVRDLVTLAVRWAEGLEGKTSLQPGAAAARNEPARPEGIPMELSSEVKSWLEKMKKSREDR